MIIDSSIALSPERHRRGFTLFEVSLILLSCVFAAILAGWWVGQIRQRARCDRFVEDLRTFSTAFHGYRQKQGKWPAGNNGAVVIPAGMERSLQETNWLKPTPLGGNYSWGAPSPTPAEGKALEVGTLRVTAFPPNQPLEVSAADLLYIDGQIDDGNLATGNFRTGFNGWPVYLVKL